ncbi:MULTISPECIES: tripartite tricarboxylate transporter substrate binding protein [unclassified Acidovorax]|uniref:Bug family tripartite tricarboxylate transporter substrate binding protein n=1 Tax=unclassified Acidovorax TaxID=2684926 RepID=UPI001C458F04|nr:MULTISPECIES: tripartite tricarboxylate transporter substrate binding protein [unclassified Acidovorax]MBV7430750.1 tripartite tricarboxylate transporter substrate binding protein [Acidovorax sp. sif0732]MBV7451856.1 tripartite tricarboxylate transporter substrate binding protein [Acidovorax sp. sif0715]
MNPTRREFSVLAAMGLLGLNAFADTYPSKPVTIVVPQAPGGTNDTVGRILAQKLSELSNQRIIVDNRPGAGGNIGTDFAARAPKDGYTLLLTISSTQAINPALYKKVPFDPVKDFEPIAPVGVVPNVLVVNASFPARNLADFIKVARASKEEIQYASAGNGSLNHLLGAMLSTSTGVPLQHVPYRGVAPALTDVMGGQVPVAFASLPSCIEFIKSGKLRALGVSSAKRSPALPDVPSISEVVPGYVGDLWVGLFAARGTPAPVVSKLTQWVTAAVAAPDVLERFKVAGVEPLSGGPTRLAQLLQEDIARWAPIVKASGAVVD